MTRASLALCIGVVSLALTASVPTQERLDVFTASRDHPAIGYATGATTDVVAALNERLQSGAAQLSFERERGYLRGTLQALRIPVESQTLVFSETSAQAEMIGPTHPRAVYFGDDVAVGWVKGAGLLELATHDPRQGVVFYTLDQRETDAPRFKRDNSCLLCHQTWETLAVPGLQVLSTFPMSDDPRAYASGLAMDHRTPYAQRWGGWYVTRTSGSFPHLGNLPVIVPARELEAGRRPTPHLDSVRDRFDTSGYLSPCSDIVALSVLAHQTHATNLITRLGWEARVAAFDARGAKSAGASPGDSERVRTAAHDLAEYLLFADEPPLPAPVVGGCGFTEAFAARGARDSRGRSLRDVDLKKRLFRYPVSYMIDTPAFHALDVAVRALVYRELLAMLTGPGVPPQFGEVSADDRRAAIQILRRDAARPAGVVRAGARVSAYRSGSVGAFASLCAARTSAAARLPLSTAPFM